MLFLKNAFRKIFFTYPILNESSIEVVGEEEVRIIALEYYALIMNRVLFVTVIDNAIIGVVVGGPVGSPLKVLDLYKNPNSYANNKKIKFYRDLKNNFVKILAKNSANFKILKNEIEKIEFSKEPKFGMGNVPYSGRILINLKNKKAKELILLGYQDGNTILSMLNKKFM